MEEIELIAAVRVSATVNYLCWIDCGLLKGGLCGNFVFSLSLSTNLFEIARRYCNNSGFPVLCTSSSSLPISILSKSTHIDFSL